MPLLAYSSLLLHFLLSLSRYFHNTMDIEKRWWRAGGVERRQALHIIVRRQVVVAYVIIHYIAFSLLS